MALVMRLCFDVARIAGGCFAAEMCLLRLLIVQQEVC